MLRPLLGLGLAVLLLSSCAQAPKNPDPRIGSFRIAGGVSVGAYFATAESICKRYRETVTITESSCQVTPGSSVANLKDLSQGSYELVIARSDWVHAAGEGAGPFGSSGPLSEIRAIASFYAEPLNILVHEDSGILRLEDLPRARFAVQEASFDGVLFAQVMNAKDWNEASFASFRTVKRLRDSLDAFCAGSIDAFAVAVGHPSGTIKQAITDCGARLLRVAGPEIAAEAKRQPAYSLAEIPAGFYEGQDEAIATFGPRPVLLARADAPEALIRRITAAIFSDLEAFKRLYPALRPLKPHEMVSASIPVPLHPAAAAYYRENGLLN